jgi:hypothetical protein
MEFRRSMLSARLFIIQHHFPLAIRVIYIYIYRLDCQTLIATDRGLPKIGKPKGKKEEDTSTRRRKGERKKK